MLGGLLLLAVLASSYGLPANGAFFFPFHPPPPTGNAPHDFPHEGITHRHPPRGGDGGFMPVADGETHRTSAADLTAPQERHTLGSGVFSHDGGDPGDDGRGSSGGGSGQHGSGSPGGLPGRAGYGQPGYSKPPPGGDTTGPRDGHPGPDMSGVWPDNESGDAPDDLFGAPPDDPPPSLFDNGCQACDPADPAYDEFVPDPPPGDPQKSAAPVPEPSSLLLLSPVLLAFAAARVRLASRRDVA